MNVEIKFDLGNRLESLPAVFKEALAMHRIYAAAGGVPMHRVFVVGNAISSTTGKPELGIRAKISDGPGPNGTHFTVTVGPLDMSIEKFKREWPKAVQLHREASQADREEIFERSTVRHLALAIATEIALKRTVK